MQSFAIVLVWAVLLLAGAGVRPRASLPGSSTASIAENGVEARVSIQLLSTLMLTLLKVHDDASTLNQARERAES